MTLKEEWLRSREDLAMLPQSWRIRDASEEHGNGGPSTTTKVLETLPGPLYVLEKTVLLSFVEIGASCNSLKTMEYGVFAIV